MVQVWENAMQHAQIDAATAPADMSTPTSCGGPNWNDVGNGIWAGHVVSASSVGESALDIAEGQWNMHGVPSSGSDNAGGMWVGTGDSVLIQSGAGEEASNPAKYWFWNEDFPNGVRNEGPAVHAGNVLFVETEWQGNSTALYFEENVTDNVYQSFDKQGNTPDRGYRAANFIYERQRASPSIGGGLPDFASIAETGAALGTASKQQDLTTANDRYIMTSDCTLNGTPLADTGRVVSPGSWSVTYETSGPLCG